MFTLVYLVICRLMTRRAHGGQGESLVPPYTRISVSLSYDAASCVYLALADGNGARRRHVRKLPDIHHPTLDAPPQPGDDGGGYRDLRLWPSVRLAGGAGRVDGGYAQERLIRGARQGRAVQVGPGLTAFGFSD